MRPIDADALIEKCGDWYVEEGTESGFIGTLKNLLATEPTIQPVATDIYVGDKISKFIDGLEEIFADLRERHVDDSVCGLCEYDGAYIGQSGDWCNECPGFDRDDCFKLSDKTRKEWTEEIIKALPTVQPEKAQLSHEGATKDAISRQQALDAVGKYASVWMEYTDAMSKDEIAQIALNNAKSTMIRILKELPSAQPERKKGEWLPDNNNAYEMRFVCSCCKESEVVPTIGFTKYKPLWDFCPNCGADMRGEKDG